MGKYWWHPSQTLFEKRTPEEIEAAAQAKRDEDEAAVEALAQKEARSKAAIEREDGVADAADVNIEVSN